MATQITFTSIANEINIVASGPTLREAVASVFDALGCGAWDGEEDEDVGNTLEALIDHASGLEADVVVKSI